MSRRSMTTVIYQITMTQMGKLQLCVRKGHRHRQKTWIRLEDLTISAPTDPKVLDQTIGESSCQSKLVLNRFD